MLIPNADKAVVDIRKLRDYCLNLEHDDAKHKARLFSTILGMTAEDAQELRRILLEVVKTHEAQLGDLMGMDNGTRSISCLSGKIEVQPFVLVGLRSMILISQN
jgi:hypothetical protein